MKPSNCTYEKEVKRISFTMADYDADYPIETLTTGKKI